MTVQLEKRLNRYKLFGMVARGKKWQNDIWECVAIMHNTVCGERNSTNTYQLVSMMVEG